MKKEKCLVVIWKDDTNAIPQSYFYPTWKEALEDAKKFKNDWKLICHKDWEK